MDGVAAVGGLALSLSLVEQIRLGSIDAAAPHPDTWPLRRYDPAATASNLAAALPTDPAVDWVDDSLAASRTVPVRIVVGPDAVYAAGVGVVALDRADGSRRWQEDRPGGPLALCDGTMYVGAGGLGTVYALGTDGTERWTTDHSDAVESLVVADGTAFLGCESGVYAYDAGSGSRRWTDGHRWASRVLVTDGRLVTAADDGVTRYRQRSVLDVPLRSPPAVDWTSEAVDVDAVAATGIGPVVGTHVLRDEGPALVALDRAGEVRWQALDAIEREFAAATPLTVTDSHCVVGIVLDGERSRYAVGSYRLRDGARRWRRRVDQLVTALAVVDGAVLVGTDPADDAPDDAAGTVRALDTTDGRERWRVTVDPGCRSLAAVDGTVFAVTTDERVLAIR